MGATGAVLVVDDDPAICVARARIVSGTVSSPAIPAK